VASHSAISTIGSMHALIGDNPLPHRQALRGQVDCLYVSELIDFLSATVERRRSDQ
jgi:hypothetical protein